VRLRQLEYFVAICDAGSFGGAAHELLERGRQGSTLTAVGRVFLPHAWPEFWFRLTSAWNRVVNADLRSAGIPPFDRDGTRR